MTSLADLPATTLLHRIQSGELTAVAVMEACLERIGEREGTVRAFAHLDREAALAVAQAVDAAPSSGKLRGLPIGVKDILDVSGMPTGN